LVSTPEGIEVIFAEGTPSAKKEFLAKVEWT